MCTTAATVEQKDVYRMEVPREEAAAHGDEEMIVISTLQLAELREEIRISNALQSKCIEELKKAEEHQLQAVSALKLRLQDLEISRAIHSEEGVSDEVLDPKKRECLNMKLLHRQSMAKKEFEVEKLTKKVEEMKAEMEEWRKGAELHRVAQDARDHVAMCRKEMPELRQRIGSLQYQKEWNTMQTRQVMDNHSALLGKKSFLVGKIANQAQELTDLSTERSNLLGRIAYLEGKLAEAQVAKARQAEVGLASLVEAIRLV